MAKFKYAAKNSKGREIKGRLEARNTSDARKSLESRGYEVLSLKRSGSLKLNSWEGAAKSEVALFARQIAVMFRAGVDIRRAFQVMSLQGFSPYFSEVIAQVEVDVSEGEALSRAFGRHPRVFDMLFVGMVKAGENSGSLDQILFRLADHLDKEVRVRRKLKAAITYPAFVFVFALVLAFIIVQHILPTFINGVFASENMALPPSTQLLVYVTNLLNDGKFMAGLLAGVLLFGFFCRQFAQSAQGKFYIQSFLHKTPGPREVVRTLLATRFCRIFSILSYSGIPLVHALDLASASLGDYVVTSRIEKVKDDLRAGRPLAESLEGMGVFPSLLIEFLIVGEQTGRIGPLMDKLADVYDQDIDNAIETYTKLLEPLMLLIIGAVVGYVVLAVFLPVYQLVGAI